MLSVDSTEAFEAERPRLVGIAARVLGDPAEAEDVVQQAWLRLHGSTAEIESLPAWLTTVTTRLCLDRLRARIPVLEVAEVEAGAAGDPADEVALADTVGVALQVVLERLSPRERVAFVLHDTFGFEFPTIAAVLETTPVAARKLASRARAKIGQPVPEGGLADWQVVDAFMAAAAALGTPERLDGRQDVATFLNGSASAALPVLLGDRPAAAWFHRGRARVVFDITVTNGAVRRITFRADADVLAQVVRRDGAQRRRGRPDEFGHT